LGASGSLLAGGWLRGNAAASISSATDSTGIRAVQVRVDGDRVVGETQLTCDYTRRAPCEDVAAPVSVPVVTSNIGDGTWTARVGAVDAGGNFTAATTQTISVDNNAPAAPPATSPATVTTAGDTTTIGWSEPGGQTSPIASAHITLCRTGGACRTTTQAAGTGSGTATLPLADGPGRYTASVSLADAAGNHSAYNATHWTITRTAPAAADPQAPRPRSGTPPSTTLPSPRLTATASRRNGRTIVVRGSVAATARGTVTIRARARIWNRLRTVTRRAGIRNRRYEARLTLPSSRWRTATITVRLDATGTHRAASTTRTLRRR
jgi:hypothetical protein